MAAETAPVSRVPGVALHWLCRGRPAHVSRQLAQDLGSPRVRPRPAGAAGTTVSVRGLPVSGSSGRSQGVIVPVGWLCIGFLFFSLPVHLAGKGKPQS